MVCTEWGACDGRPRIHVLGEAMDGQAFLTVWSAHPGKKPRSHICIYYISPFTCALYRTPSSSWSVSEAVGGGVGLHCYTLLLHRLLKVLMKSFCEVQKCPIPHKLVWSGPQQQNFRAFCNLDKGTSKLVPYPGVKILASLARSWAISLHSSFQL